MTPEQQTQVKEKLIELADKWRHAEGLSEYSRAKDGISCYGSQRAAAEKRFRNFVEYMFDEPEPFDPEAPLWCPMCSYIGNALYKACDKCREKS